MHFIYLFIILPVLLFSQTIQFKSEDTNITVEKIASNLGVVWGMTFISDNELLFTVKTGKIALLNIKTKEIKNISNLSNTQNLNYTGQGGLLDVQKSPNFLKDNELFFTYVKEIKGKSTTVLAKAKLQNNKLINWNDLFISQAFSDTSRHFGSRITFDEEGHLYFSIGDRGVRENSQNLSNHAGSIIRLNLDGSIPSDNPFINKKDALPEIYTYGHRNPQGLFYDKTSKNLWSIEHGPRGGDEINLIEKGKIMVGLSSLMEKSIGMILLLENQQQKKECNSLLNTIFHQLLLVRLWFIMGIYLKNTKVIFFLEL